MNAVRRLRIQLLSQKTHFSRLLFREKQVVKRLILSACLLPICIENSDLPVSIAQLWGLALMIRSGNKFLNP